MLPQKQKTETNELEDLQREVRAVKRYLRVQNKIVEETVDDWNRALLDLQREIAQLEEYKKELLRQIFELDQTRLSMV